jgi:hypothetical protein
MAVKKNKSTDSKELARKAGNALRRAAKQAHRIAAAYGTPVYIEKNGKIIALKPKVR